jgi:Tripartite tricarboxylate transporter family receptor
MTVLELSGTTIRIVELRPGSTTMKSATLRCDQLLLKTATRFLVDCKTHDLARAISVPETEGATLNIPYDVLNDFEPVSLLADTPIWMVARKTLPAKDLKELIAWLKQNPGKATYLSTRSRQRLLCSISTSFRIGVGDGRLGRGEVSELDPMLPREFLAAPAHPPARMRRVLIAVHVVEAVRRVRALGAQDQRAVVAQEQRNGCRHQALDGRRGCWRRLGCQRCLSRRGVGHRCFGHGREMAPARSAPTHSGENIFLSLIWNPILIDRTVDVGRTGG